MAKKKMARKTDFVSQGDTGLHSACGAQDVAKGAAGEAPAAMALSRSGLNGFRPLLKAETLSHNIYIII